MDNKEYIVAIDFGSSTAGYAYALKPKDGKINKIYDCKFKKTGEKVKTLNEVIINDSNEIVKFGYDVRDYMKNSKLKKGEHLYQRIKMNLYKNLTEIESVNSTKSIDIVTLISIILEYLKKDAIQLILKQIKGYKDANKIDYNKESDKIRWVLTIPAIWDEKNKYIMMEAAKKAGIVDENNKALFFALEPEAASYYCSKELEIDDSIFKKPYIICDLGGGTADIVCHERVFENKIEKIIEKCTPKGGPFGSDEINKEFEDKVLKLLFGEDIFKTIKNEFIQNLNGNQNSKQIQHKYIRLIEQINEFKEGLTDDYLDESYPIDCSLFFLKFKDLDIEKAVNNYNKKCYPEWRITEYGREIEDRTIFFPYKIIYDLTKNLTDKISKILLEIISEVKEVSTIFYVGGFSNSTFAFKLLKNDINNKNPKINHLLPPYPEKAILRGAIYYGLSPQRIKSRKAKYTLGMNAYMNWDEKKYGKKGIKIFDTQKNNYCCENAFLTFISKNDDIPYDNKITKQLGLRWDKQDGSFGGHLVLYKSNKPEVTYIDEEGVEEVGKLDLFVESGNYLGDNFEATIELGGTYLNVTASHRKSNTKCSMEFENIDN